MEMAIKLSINSLYGKTVQCVGGTEYEPPSCACPYYGSAITANCRARLLEAALLDPYAIVGFMKMSDDRESPCHPIMAILAYHYSILSYT
jgi:hypothetical protein